MRFVDADEIRRLLTFPKLIDALEVAHRRVRMEVQDGLLGHETEQYFVRSAVDTGLFMASKLITSFPANHVPSSFGGEAHAFCRLQRQHCPAESLAITRTLNRKAGETGEGANPSRASRSPCSKIVCGPLVTLRF